MKKKNLVLIIILIIIAVLAIGTFIFREDIKENLNFKKSLKQYNNEIKPIEKVRAESSEIQNDLDIKIENFKQTDLEISFDLVYKIKDMKFFNNYGLENYLVDATVVFMAKDELVFDTVATSSNINEYGYSSLIYYNKYNRKYHNSGSNFYGKFEGVVPQPTFNKEGIAVA